MSNWEYKIISSGKGGFASPALMEKFLNDLGQEQWEIIHFHTPPENPLAFSGLARRTTQRDWTLEDAAAAAARAEADKLRAEFEAKFKAATSTTVAAEEPGETFLAEEKPGADDGFRRPVDTSRDADPDAPDDEGGGKDEWDKLAEEDELPSFFDALKPHMRRNQRGPGMSVGVDYLAKKWRLDEADIKGALVECGMQIPADENAKSVYVEYDGDLYWVNINRRGEIWINVREKPQPVFRVVPGRRVGDDEVPASSQPAAPERERAAPERERHTPERERHPSEGHDDAGASENEASQQDSGAPKSLLDRIRAQMRRNRHGHGWSGSFGFLTKALRTDEAGLLAQLGETGLKFAPEGSEKPEFHEENGFVYWLQRNHRGEIWINARRERKGEEGAGARGQGTGDREQGTSERGQGEGDRVQGTGDREQGSAASSEPPLLPAPGNTLAAVRLLLQPKKRGEGVTAQVSDLASQLGRPAIELLEALVAAGLNVPDDPDTKPTFGEYNGEIFWLNRNAKDELWLNAKAAGAKRPRSRKKSEPGEGETAAEQAEPAVES